MTAYTISVVGLALGAQGVNSLSADFTNPAATVIQHTNWTPLNVKYLYANSASNYTVKSVSGHDTRDMEATTWMRQGYVFLRLDGSGNAIYFFHNGETTSGTLQVGIVTGLDQGSYPSGTYYLLYENTDCVGTITGYNRTDTTGDSFTFGVSGFDIYMKFDSGSGAVEFCRFKEYRQMSVGGMALKSDSTAPYGFRDITHTTLAIATLASDYTNHQVNMGDWGLRSLQTTGTISASSTALTVASNPGFAVGDYVVVEIGAEAGLGARGTIGVGGVWPTSHYATTALLFAAAPTTNTFAWADDTTEVWRYVNTALTSITGSPGTATFNIATNTFSLNDKVTFKTSGTLPSPLVAGTTYFIILAGYTGTTFEVSTTLGGSAVVLTTAGSGTHSLNWAQSQPYASVNYYGHLALPRSLLARITNVAGTAITLDTAATAAATNANVYLDNQLYFNDLLQPMRGAVSAITWSTMDIAIPAGSYYCAGDIRSTESFTGWSISGAGQASTALLSPRGCRGVGIKLQNFAGVTIENFALSGNLSGVPPSKFGLAYFDTMVPTPVSTLTTQYTASGLIIPVKDVGSVNETTFGESWFQTSGILLNACNGGVVQDVTINNVFTNGVTFQATTDGWAYRCTVNCTYQQQSYTQWQMDWVNTVDGGCEDCRINSTYLCPGLESFSSTGTQFNRMTSVNASYSLNNAGGWSVRDSRVRSTASSISPVWTVGNPLIQISNNTGSSLSGPGGTMHNMKITVDGFIDGSNDIPIGIIITGGTPAPPNVSINCGNYIAPDWVTPGQIPGPQAIYSDGTGTSVSHFYAGGATEPGAPTVIRSNIGLNGTGSSVTNSVAAVIVQTSGTASGNLTSSTVTDLCAVPRRYVSFWV